MPTCKECYYGEICKDMMNRTYYYCHFESDIIEQCIAEDNDCGCDAFVDYRNDDTTKRS